MPTTIHTLDLNFQGAPGTIAAYLIPHGSSAVLVECGPASTFSNLQAALLQSGFTLHQVSDVFVTHIHLDHAGAAGWLAGFGARIHVHPAGLPHLADPSRLLASASRLYGDQMSALWGETRPVPAELLLPMQDGDEFQIGNSSLRAIETPGHANHHLVFRFEDALFTGDTGGVRLPGSSNVLLPLVPPELNLERWRLSLQRLKLEKVARIGPTHFGLFDDPSTHLDAIGSYMDEIERWMEQEMVKQPSPEDFRRHFESWQAQWLRLSPAEMKNYEIASPTFLSVEGLQRYWKKYRSI